jgi:hypothetical protein
MAKPSIPNPLERRLLLQRELDPGQALAYAKAYLADDRQVEAIDFLVKAEAAEELDALAEQATADGNAFLLRLVTLAQRVEPSPETWARLSEAARAAGLDAYAETAERNARLGEEE